MTPAEPTPETFRETLRKQGIDLPESDLAAALPSAVRLLRAANRLLEQTDV
ncbi:MULTISPECIES: hypothetical protein [unclassified Salipiger]|uniref:hypothetical protein n=1 Tax=unclassified Salipiger TaxID=2640570 RepID=UPI0013B951E0|nr:MULTISPECIES: hypothetical protein [unclassified Salipiger]NDV49856.1 hypothetical protein [Salipiger sp. PrR003]NDW32494.1 hypothetical protein [Salipiger sp. PrR007]